MGLYEIKNLLYNKRNGKQNEEAAHEMGKEWLPAIHVTRN
jgi:hypothetical protein